MFFNIKSIACCTNEGEKFHASTFGYYWFRAQVAGKKFQQRGMEYLGVSTIRRYLKNAGERLGKERGDCNRGKRQR